MPSSRRLSPRAQKPSLTGSPPGWGDALDASTEPGSAVVVLREDARVRIVARSSRPALVVLNDSWFPGWEAVVDGAPAEIFRANLSSAAWRLELASTRSNSAIIRGPCAL